MLKLSKTFHLQINFIKGSMMVAYIVVLFSFITWCCQYADGTVPQTCTKFDEVDSLDVSVEVAGVCYYAFVDGNLYQDAEDLCESEDTHLAHYETEQEQIDVWHAIGSNYGQHWMGLKFVDGKWVWWDNGKSTDVTSSRWQGEPSGEAAFTTTDANRGVWSATQESSWFRTVCEDGSSAVDETTTTSTTTTTTSTTTTTTTPTTATPVISGGIGYASFLMTSSLSDVVEIESSRSVYALDCGRKCFEREDCHYFRFVDELCKLYDYQSAGLSIECDRDLLCYRRIL